MFHDHEQYITRDDIEGRERMDIDKIQQQMSLPNNNVFSSVDFWATRTSSSFQIVKEHKGITHNDTRMYLCPSLLFFLRTLDVSDATAYLPPLANSSSIWISLRPFALFASLRREQGVDLDDVMAAASRSASELRVVKLSKL